VLGDDQEIMKENTGYRHRHNRGVSFVELLVALVVMSIGVLGVASLQAISLQQNRSALFRAEATQLANDMLDRIRSNPFGSYAADIDDEPESTSNCYQVNCNADQMAAFDISSWKCQIDSTDADDDTYDMCTTLGISSSLPDASGGVTVGAPYSIEVRWVDDRDGNEKSIILRSVL
jgi:type IV pilus assembly protein PilV